MQIKELQFLPLVVNTDFLCGVLSFLAVQPCSQQLLQLQQFEVRLLVFVTEVEDELQSLHQLLQILLCTHRSCLGQVRFGV